MNNPFISVLDRIWTHSYFQQCLLVATSLFIAHIVNHSGAQFFHLRRSALMVLGLFGIRNKRAPVSFTPEDEQMQVDEHVEDAFRTRARQLRKISVPDGERNTVEKKPEFYPGLVNISGTYCFLNSTIQALASVTYLRPFLEHLHEKAEEVDVPTPVTDALRDILKALNEPSARFRAIRPVAIISALADSSIQNSNTLFLSREHQDAQELFQLLSSVLQEETVAVEQETLKDLGLGTLSERRTAVMPSRRIELQTPFDGLSANRRTCVDCGYTEAVMHFPFDNITLAVPPQASCSLEECLNDYTRIESLTDCICQKCSLLATLRKLKADAGRLASNTDKDATSSKKKRGREAKRLEIRVKTALDEGRIEEDIKGVKLEKVYSSNSTKQTMIARPPRILAIHLNRSTYFGSGYAGRNPCRVRFPELLDLTDFTTSGELNTQPEASLSAPRALARSACTADRDRVPVIYRLSSVVCHYGTHSYGHYVAFRRKPPSAGSKCFVPPVFSCPMDCTCDECLSFGSVRDTATGKPGGWLRISDDAVQEVSLPSVLAESSGTFMLYYERVGPSSSLGDPIATFGPAGDVGDAGEQIFPRGRVVRSVKSGSSVPDDVPADGFPHETDDSTPPVAHLRTEGAPSSPSGTNDGMHSVEVEEPVSASASLDPVLTEARASAPSLAPAATPSSFLLRSRRSEPSISSHALQPIDLRA